MSEEAGNNGDSDVVEVNTEADDIQNFVMPSQEELEASLEAMLYRGAKAEGIPDDQQPFAVLHPEEHEETTVFSAINTLLINTLAVPTTEAQNFILVTNRKFKMENNQPVFGEELSDSVSYWIIAGKKYTRSPTFPELKAGHTLVYVHGFYNSVTSAVDAAKLVGKNVRDANVTNVICFSWPSQNSPIKYDVDVERQAKSVPALTDLFYGLQKARANPSTDKVHLVAHSLGNRTSIAALVAATIKNTEPLADDVLGCLFFCAADVDINTSANPIGFQAYLSSLSTHAGSITSYACDSDTALYTSSTKFYNGVYRGGRYGPVACSSTNDYTTLLWEGPTNVDNGINHNSFKEPTVMADMKRAIAKDTTRETYWKTVKAGVSDEPKHHTEYYAKHRVFYIHK